MSSLILLMYSSFMNRTLMCLSWLSSLFLLPHHFVECGPLCCKSPVTFGWNRCVLCRVVVLWWYSWNGGTVAKPRLECLHRTQTMWFGNLAQECGLGQSRIPHSPFPKRFHPDGRAVIVFELWTQWLAGMLRFLSSVTANT